MDEYQKEESNPQVEPEIEEEVSGEKENPEDATMDEVNTAPEDSDELLNETGVVDTESEDAVNESAEGDLIPDESDKSKDETLEENDKLAAEAESKDLEGETLDVEEAGYESEAEEEVIEEPAAEMLEGELETQDEREEPNEIYKVAVGKEVDTADDRDWFVIHCYSGYENKVRHNLEQRIETMGMKDKIFDVVVPTEEEIEVKDGKRRTVERRVFPGYILVQMILNEDSWYVVRNTPGVTGFVGMGNEPTPLRPEEVTKIVKRMEADAPRIKLAYSIGQKVRIIDGPFNDFIGTVADIDMERAMVRVMVSFFGRETPVELDFLQVDKA
jgi:transcriptional antiterminator NusG